MGDDAAVAGVVGVSVVFPVGGVDMDFHVALYAAQLWLDQ